MSFVNLSRRELFWKAASCLALLSYKNLSFSAMNPKDPYLGSILIGTSQASNSFSFSVLTELGTLISQVNLSYLVHSVVAVPFKQCFVPISIGKEASVIVIRKEKNDVIKISPLKNHQFAGHGCVLSDHDTLITSETHLSSQEGSLVYRSLQTLSILKVVRSGGYIPHELRISEKKKLLAVAHKGQGSKKEDGSNIVFHDLNTGKFLRQHRTTDFEQKILHFSLNQEGNFIAASSPDIPMDQRKIISAQIFTGNETSNEILKSVYPSDSKKESALLFKSVEINFLSTIAGVTAPLNDEVLFFDVKRAKLLNKIKIKSPEGIALSADKKYFIISNKTGGLSFILAKDMSISHEISNLPINGPHLLAI